MLIEQYLQRKTFRAANIAFGSCTSYDLRDMDIWNTAIIPSEPDVWIWTGDMVYLDDNEIDCNVFEDSQDWQASCNCTPSYINSPPHSCHAGDPDYASRRWTAALSNGYAFNQNLSIPSQYTLSPEIIQSRILIS